VGTDLESHLIARSIDRATKLGLEKQTQFITVKPGPLLFDDNSFDVIISSGAFTQIEDKLSMYKECLRVLKPGGTLSCYDWMKSPGEFSEDMLYWFKLEGLTYAMKTPEEHQALLLAAGFSTVTCTDKTPWYKQKAREEYNLIKTQLYPEVEALLGKAEADLFEEDWRALVVVCEKNEMLQVYTRAIKA
jgi:phosphoethanolamine N-methyltransferase